MSTQDESTRKGFEEFGRKVGKTVDTAVTNLDQEGERLIAYLNSEVVPAIRSGSSKALRTAAEKLGKLAEYMEQNRSK